MTDAQRDKLQVLCDRYNVAFNEADYYHPFDLPDGWVAGWIGGMNHAASLPGSDRPNNPKATIYVGVSPEGDASS